MQWGADAEARAYGERVLRASALTVDGDDWKLYVYSVTRVGPDIFLQLALLGPRVCTMTVRALPKVTS